MKDNRRYYLHRRIKMFTSLFAANKNGIIYVPHNYQTNFSEKQLFYIDELRATGKYSVQLGIS